MRDGITQFVNELMFSVITISQFSPSCPPGHVPLHVSISPLQQTIHRPDTYFLQMRILDDNHRLARAVNHRMLFCLWERW